ncbi:MAG: hypothetical protein ACOYMG_16065 [Candidatus Methylumidiphilus sp.]
MTVRALERHLGLPSVPRGSGNGPEQRLPRDLGGGTGTATQGAVHCHPLKSLDWQARKAEYRETVPDFIMDEVTARLLPFIDPDS